MKKSAKISIIAGALALSTCIGAVALVGCNKSSFNPWTNLTPTSFSDLQTTANTYDMNFDMDFQGISVAKNYESGSKYINYTLQLKSVDNETYAHFNIDANLIIDETKSTHVKGDVYLIKGIMYVDDGTFKYSATYRGGLYENGSDGGLKDHELLNKYLYKAINAARKDEKPDAAAAVASVKSRLEKCVVYTCEHNGSTYFQVNYATSEAISNDTKKINEIYRFSFGDQKLQSYETIKTNSTSLTSESTALKYQRYEGTINLPTDSKNYPYRQA